VNKTANPNNKHKKANTNTESKQRTQSANPNIESKQRTQTANTKEHERNWDKGESLEKERSARGRNSQPPLLPSERSAPGSIK
jgi:hypothetical protein